MREKEKWKIRIDCENNFTLPVSLVGLEVKVKSESNRLNLS